MCSKIIMGSLLLLMTFGLLLIPSSQCQMLQSLQLNICPSQGNIEEKCVPWSEIVSNTTSLVHSNTILYFFPGEYHISSAIVFQDLHNFSLTGMGVSPSHLFCTRRDSGVTFSSIHGLRINNLKFSNCGAQSPEIQKITHSSWYTSILMLNCWNIDVHELIVRDGNGYGVSGINILGKSTIRNSVFTNMNGGGGVFIMYRDFANSKLHLNHSISFLNSNFTDNICLKNLVCEGTGLHIHLRQTTYSVEALICGAQVLNNQANGTAGVSVVSESINQNTIRIKNSLFQNNTVYAKGTSGFDYIHVFPLGSDNKYGKTTVEVLTSNFTQNIGQRANNPYENIASDVLDFTMGFERTPHYISIRECIISNNIGGRHVGLGASIINEPGQQSHDIVLEVKNTTFTNNTSTAYINYKRDIVQILYMPNVTFDSCLFEGNTGTAILAQSSNISFKDINTFRGNLGSYGGGLALYKKAVLYLHTSSKTFFVNNKVTNNGGGIYIASTESIEATLCSLQIVGFDLHQIFVFFSNNTAKLSGNDLFGGNLDICFMGLTPGQYAIKTISHNLNQNSHSTLDFSSKPSRVCHCDNGMPDCLKYIKDITTYPGKIFTVPLLAIGQLIYTNFTLGVPSAIYASIEDDETEKLPHSMHVQAGKRTCSELTYSIHSYNGNEIMVLTSDEEDTRTLNSLRTYIEYSNNRYTHQQLTVENLRIPIYVNVTLLPCPFGFQISSRNVCECAAILNKLKVNCSIDTLSFRKEPLSWIGTELRENSGSGLALSNSTLEARQILVHFHCPYDYCNSKPTFLLEDSDTQCSNNRSGILCGQCKPGLSVMLGSSKCRRCSDTYLTLLFPFALAGLLLIAFLIFTDMTVASGMINGLLFYANVVNINKSSLFPPGTDHGVLFTILAWLNLDLGIETCFCDGMDSYVNAWLQFVFPFYVWLLAGLIIVASRYSNTVNRICGRNIVQVLATLFLLSYTKLQRAVISGLSFTFVERESGRFAVWLLDGNILYLHGKHIYFFTFTFICLVGIILPYTLAILMGPWLQSKTDYRIFTWVNKLKPLYDAYLGPFKNGLRCWAGLLLLARGLFLLIAAVNVLGDTSVNLLGMCLICSLLVALVWQKGGVYRLWVLSCLESFFLLNLTVISSVSLYNKCAGGSQGLAISISVGSSVVVFILLLGYHLIKRFKAIAKNSVVQNPHMPAIPDYIIDNSDETMIKLVDEGRDGKTGISTTVIDRPNHSLVAHKDMEMDLF